MNEFKERGGVRIGRATASWPLATLMVSRDKLEVNAGMIGNLVFRSQDIIAIREEGTLGRGLRISHRVSTYNETVVFSTFGDTGELLRKIERTGFLNNESSLSAVDDAAITKAQASGARPVKTAAWISLVVIWNVCFAYDFISAYNDPSIRLPGVGIVTALSCAFVTCLLLLILEPFRILVLKEGRTLAHVRSFTIFMVVITGILMLSMMLAR
jgi:hypothetical protein